MKIEEHIRCVICKWLSSNEVLIIGMEKKHFEMKRFNKIDSSVD